MSSDGAKRSTVLVVDDSALMRTVISDVIGGFADFRVVGTARDGREALEQIRALDPDIVTLDVDGQYDVKDIALLLGPISDGRVHATLGCRAPSEHDKPSLGVRLRSVLYALGKVGARLGLRPPVPDAHNGLCAFTRHAAQMIDLKLDRMNHGSEIVQQILAGGLKMQEVPVRVRVSDYALRKGQRSSAALRVAMQYIKTRLTR